MNEIYTYLWLAKILYGNGEAECLKYLLQEVVERFENQGSTTSHLEELKKDNTKQILRLQEEKANRQKAFEEMKYSGEAKLSRYAACWHKRK